jgi:hypothetical protein
MAADYVVWILLELADKRRVAVVGDPAMWGRGAATKAECERALQRWELQHGRIRGEWTATGPPGRFTRLVDGWAQGRWCAPAGDMRAYWWKPTAGYTWSSFEWPS